jgi:hypothetical protein
MEIIIPFKKADFTDDGTYIASNKFFLDLQRDWEEMFFNKLRPYLANVIEGHPAAMHRLTRFWEGDNPEYDFGMELIDGEIDLDTNLEIEKFSETKTVYAIGSQLHDDEANPLFLVKNENISDEILVLKYVSDDDEPEKDVVNVPVEGEYFKIK